MKYSYILTNAERELLSRLEIDIKNSYRRDDTSFIATTFVSHKDFIIFQSLFFFILGDYHTLAKTKERILPRNIFPDPFLIRSNNFKDEIKIIRENSY